MSRRSEMVAARFLYRGDQRYSTKLGLNLTEALWEELAKGADAERNVRELNHFLTLAEASHEDTSHAGDVPSKILDRLEPILEEALACGEMVHWGEGWYGRAKIDGVDYTDLCVDLWVQNEGNGLLMDYGYYPPITMTVTPGEPPHSEVHLDSRVVVSYFTENGTFAGISARRWAEAGNLERALAWTWLLRVKPPPIPQLSYRHTKTQTIPLELHHSFYVAEPPLDEPQLEWSTYAGDGPSEILDRFEPILKEALTSGEIVHWGGGWYGHAELDGVDCAHLCIDLWVQNEGTDSLTAYGKHPPISISVKSGDPPQSEIQVEPSVIVSYFTKGGTFAGISAPRWAEIVDLERALAWTWLLRVKPAPMGP